MIVLDTNVLSEPLKPHPSPAVLTWMQKHSLESALTTISIAELLYGVRRLPDGARRTRLHEQVETLIEGAGARQLPFDEAAARQYAQVRAAGRAAGRTMSAEDLMIAAICLARDCALATRNVRDFEGAGVRIVNPWEDESAGP
jgi:predicted nucleic acid-binding protein